MIDKPKISILTFIFGQYELLREVQNYQSNIEYVCVTDNFQLKSNTWKIIIDKNLVGFEPFRKVLEVRYNPFKYVHSDICLIIDGSIQILQHPRILLDFFANSNYELATLVHPNRHSVLTEIDTWKFARNLPDFDVNVCKQLISNISYDANYKGLFQVSIILVKNTRTVNRLFSQILAMNNKCAIKNSTFRVDQILFTMIVNKEHNIENKLLPLSSKELYGKYFMYCRHGTNIPIRRYPINKYKEDYQYVFNRLHICYHIDELLYVNDDITAAICNFNTTKLTNTVLKGLFQFSECKKIIVLDNSDKEKFQLDKNIDARKIEVLDNTQQKYINFNKLLSTYPLSFDCKKNNYASLKHTMSIQFLLNICTTKYLLLCDSDIIIKKKIDFIEDGYATIADIEETGQASQNMNTNLGKNRFMPFMQLFNMKQINLHKIKYFNINRIHGIKQGMLYDTGASLYEDIIERKHLPYKQIKLDEYITHLAHGSWK